MTPPGGGTLFALIPILINKFDDLIPPLLNDSMASLQYLPKKKIRPVTEGACFWVYFD